MTKESCSTHNGRITQINYTEKRSDGKIETRHLNPDSGRYTGKSVHNTETGRTEYYTREEAGMGGCFLTTACTLSRGLSDNCLELNTLRRFRDEILIKDAEGLEAVEEYYRIAPNIVNSINQREDSSQIWSLVYQDVKKAVSLVLSSNFDEAFKHYKEMTLALKKITS